MLIAVFFHRLSPEYFQSLVNGLTQKTGLLLCLLAFQFSANATTKFWTSFINNSWNEGANWFPVGVPAPGDDVVINTNAQQSPTIFSGTTVQARTISVSGRNLTIASGGSLTVLPSPSMVGISLSNANLFNSGSLTIGSGAFPYSVANVALQIGAGSSFQNNPCGTAHFWIDIENAGTFQNFGLVSTNTFFDHVNTGTFTNNGVLADFYDAFDQTSFTNNDLWIPKLVFCENLPATNALIFGAANNFTVSANWTENGSTAGTFSQATNTFTPTSSPDPTAHTYNFSVSGNGCTFNVSANAIVGALPTPSILVLGGGSTTICSTGMEIPLQANPGVGGNLSYEWSNGDQDDFTVVNQIGTYTVTVTNNFGGCSATATSPAIVADTEPPVARCHAGTQVFIPFEPYVAFDEIEDGSTDNCGIANYEVSDHFFTCGSHGFHTVSLTVTDYSGNTSSCSMTVLAAEPGSSSAAFINCKTAATVTTNWGLNTYDLLDLPFTNDACGLESYQFNPPVLNCPGTYDVTVSGTDQVLGGGNGIASCTLPVTIVDDTPPQAKCKNATASLDINGTASITVAAINNASSDNCSMSNVQISQSTFGCSDVGNKIVTLTATDNSGNTSTCTATVQVSDGFTPSVNYFAAPTLNLNASGQATLSATGLVTSSFDNCPLTFALTKSNFTCADIGTQTVQLQAIESHGRITSYNIFVTVNDNTAPTTRCKAAALQLNASGQATLALSDFNDGTSDNCTLQNVVLNKTSFNCSNRGPNIVRLTAIDQSNNSSSCTAIVTVTDPIAPTATCKNHTTYLNASGQATIFIFDLHNGLADNCSIYSFGLSKSTFDCTEIGQHIVTVTVSDASGNTATCTSTVTVADNTAPMAVCKNFTAILDNSGQATITMDDLDNGSTDNCGTPNRSISQSVFDCQHLGNQSIVLTATDASGNSSQCSATVSVVDNAPPTMLCKNFTVILENGSASISANELDNGSSDICGIQNQSLSQSNFDCQHIGTHIVALTGSDLSANSASCTASVTVLDNDFPTALCRNLSVALDIAGQASVTTSSADAGSSDICGLQSLVLSKTDFDCADAGDNYVTLTATDPSGNASTCTAVVTVLDVLNYAEFGRRNAADGLSLDKFGWSLALASDVALAGAPEDKIGTITKQGSAHIFLRDLNGPGSWGHLKLIKASDGAASDFFGRSAALDGDFAFVGTELDNVGANTDQGSAYIFKKDLGGADNWGQLKQLAASDGEAYEYFGNSMSAHAGRAVAGAYSEKNGTTTNLGAAYLFEKDLGGSDNWGQRKKLTASDRAASHKFGTDVSISGDYALVGAPGHTSSRGAAYIFQKDQGGTDNWGELKKLTPADPANGDLFGISVYLSGDWAIVGAFGKQSQRGYAYIFQKDQGGPDNWGQVAKIGASDGAAGAKFGSDVAVAGDHAYVSASAAAGKGAVYVFHRNMGGPDQWGQIARHEASDAATNDNFGQSLAISGATMGLGAPLDDVGTASDRGSMYVLEGMDCGGVPRTGRDLQAGEAQNPTEERGLIAETSGFALYPNPVRGDDLFVNLKNFAGEKAQLELRDALGRLLETRHFEALPDGEIAWAIGHLSPGAYFVSLKTEGARALARPFVVQR